MLVSAALLAGLVVAVGTVRRHPDADPVALALSPVLALTLYRSTDLLPLALAVVAVWAWSRDRTRLAGVLGGLALLAGPLSAVVLLAMALLPGRDGADARRRLLVTTAVTVAVVAVPVALVDAGALTASFRAWRRAVPVRARPGTCSPWPASRSGRATWPPSPGSACCSAPPWSC